jgi:alpha-N-acetylglucosamine transferase
MNPYVAAAKFVMEKNATERDIRNTATQIVVEVLKYENKIKEEAALHH